ncbi:MAG: undecaprenyl-diphosphate phosphatase [Verrucomicrobiae bacterium]|jgi:undecaprenyl-diphosphatase|nr:undecaprenyl-diphosphate phosphatase [Verrucomicrobiae bacterium]
MLSYLQIFLLAIIQGLCELLPVSSSAHVIVAERIMGLNPSAPAMTLLLVMLHTGTMFAVILYFWKEWQFHYFSSFKKFRQILTQVFVATLCTGVLGLLLKIVIEKIFMRHLPHAEIEHLFSNLPLISFALAAVGSVMIYAGTRKKVNASQELNIKSSCWIGIIQGISLPFRGFSRSGSTISMGLILGISKKKIEAFSFALAVVLTPLVIAKELHRFLHDATITSSSQTFHLLVQCGAGMVLSFLAGLIALKWLSHWLEEGRWKFFGFYCLVAAGGILVLNYFFL